MEKINVSIVIPIYIYNSSLFRMTKKCLEDIKFNTVGINQEIIVIDDASPETKMVDLLSARFFSDAVWIRNPVNKGFAYSINRGIVNAKNDLILLLNNDIEVINSSWLRDMIKIMSLNKWDMTSPAYGLIDTNYNYVPKNKHFSISKAFQYLDGWCVLSKKQVFETIGLLPLDFSRGFWEDTLFSRVVKNSNKFKIGISNNIGIKHLGHTTFRTIGYDINKAYTENRQKYIDIVEGKIPFKLPTIVEFLDIISKNSV